MPKPRKIDNTTLVKRYKTATEPPEEIAFDDAMPMTRRMEVLHEGDMSIKADIRVKNVSATVVQMYKMYCARWGYTLAGSLEALMKEAVRLNRQLHRFDKRKWKVKKGGLDERKPKTKPGN